MFGSPTFRDLRLALLASLFVMSMDGRDVLSQTNAVPSESSVAPKSAGQTAETLATTVAGLIRQLDAETADSRRDALRQLQSLGLAALPWLPPADRVESRAARETVVRLRNQWEREAALQSVQPSRITLATHAPWAEIVSQLASTTRNPIGPIGGAFEDRMSVTWSNRTFWEATNQILGFTHEPLRWNADASRLEIGDRAVIPDRTKPLPPSSADGIFRIIASVAPLRPLPNNPEAAGLSRVTLTWQAEPRLRPLFLRIKTADWSGMVNGLPMPPWSPQAEYEIPFADGAPETSSSLEFVRPKAALPNQEWSLTGKATVHLAALSEVVEFDALALKAGVVRQRGGVTVKLLAVEVLDHKEATADLRVRLSVAYEVGGPAFESHRIGLLHTGAKLFGPNQQPYSLAETQVAAEGDGVSIVDYRFSKVPIGHRDIRFVYSAPTAFIDIPVAVQFERLPVADAAPSKVLAP